MAATYKDASILLVDDNDNDAELAMRALDKSKLGDRVFRVRDGEAALEFIFGTGRYADRDTSKNLEVIILDLNMPKVGGFEVLQRVKGDRQLQSTPVVVSSSSRESEDVQKAFRLGANGFVPKPVDVEGITSAAFEAGLYWMMIDNPQSGNVA